MTPCRIEQSFFLPKNPRSETRNISKTYDPVVPVYPLSSVLRRAHAHSTLAHSCIFHFSLEENVAVGGFLIGHCTHLSPPSTLAS